MREDQTDFSALDDLIKLVCESAQPITLLNAKRFEEMSDTKAHLERLLPSHVKITLSVDPLFCLGGLRIEVDELSFSEQELCSFFLSCSLADHLEIYPLTNGNIMLCMTFRHMTTPVSFHPL